ncbi:MAG: PDDEXK nuclease domain-containing protein [Verrucomicrobiales bacterium]|nr:PDDEXK nuclease domain-containing protein [Verrucomicrobiales bacterium]
MKKKELALYTGLFGDIKMRVRTAQHRAALAVNAEMILLYWDIGHMIAARQEQEGWGKGVIPRLSIDLKNELPEQKGFSVRNIGYMVRFAREYGPPPILQQAAAKLESTGSASLAKVTQTVTPLELPLKIIIGIPWFHHVVLIEKLKDLPTRYWYAKQAFEQGWTRDTLTVQIKSRIHERQGAAITNFATTLPEVHASIAHGLLKDPYIFDFLTLSEPFRERELEIGLLRHLEKFLLELGSGFSFVGRQYRLEVSGRDFYLDLLFYHLELRCFIVIDLKKGDFKPEYVGKMNFYCSAVDDLLRHEHDALTIGLILCQTKDRILAEYSLRDMHKPIGLADYELTRALPKEIATNLPSIEDIETELSEELDKEEGS